MQQWFITEPLDRNFCRRVTRLQLFTESYDKQKASNGGESGWFEVAILHDAQATEPRILDDKALVVRTHSNTMNGDVDPLGKHFGVVIDRRQDFLDALSVSRR